MFLFDKQYHPASTAPGTLTKAQSADAKPLRIRLIDYDIAIGMVIFFRSQNWF